MATVPAARRPGLWFAAWALVGATYAVVILGVLTIGLFVLPVSLAATLLLARRRGAPSSGWGALSGLGLPLLYVAWLNRDGPGEVCRAIGGQGQSCTQELSPWPWVAAGTALVVAGIVAYLVCRRGQAGTFFAP